MKHAPETTLFDPAKPAPHDSNVVALPRDGSGDRIVIPIEVEFLSGHVPEEARFVRRIGCPDADQVDIFELGQSLFMIEVGTSEGRPILFLNTQDLFRKGAAAVLKANRGEAAAWPGILRWMRQVVVRGLSAFSDEA